jgi:hypothetical protein
MHPASPSGQASADYVGLLALVAVVLALSATAVGAPWMPSAIAGEIRHGICVVSGSLCTPAEAERAGLAPCPVYARSTMERAGARVSVIRLDRDDALVIERRSDRTVSISFVDGWRGGGEAGAGLSISGGRGQVSGGAGASFHAGRTYEFPDQQAARRFLRRFAGEETLSGEGRRLFRALCWHCPEWLEGQGRELPEPSATYREGGAWADLRAAFRVSVPVRGTRAPLDLQAELTPSAIVGTRTAGRRRTTYLRLGHSAVGRAGTLLGSLTHRGDTEVVLDSPWRRGGPSRPGLRTALEVGTEAALLRSSLDVADVARWHGAGPNRQRAVTPAACAWTRR